MGKNNRDNDRMLLGYRILEEELEIRYRGEYTARDIATMAKRTVQAQFLTHYFSWVPPWRLILRRLMSKDRVLPDFACVGPMKSGTTDLTAYLLEHPSVVPPLTKEPGTLDAESWRIYYPTADEMNEVADRTGKAVTGYFDPKFHQIRIIDSYHAARPDAKIIVTLRDPVRRAYSQFKWDIAIGRNRSLPAKYSASYLEYVRRALDVYPALGAPTAIQSMPFLQTGIYEPSVRLWLDKFGRENVYILRTEDFFQDPIGVVQDVYRFLDLSEFTPSPHTPVNKSAIPAPSEDPEARKLLSEFYKPWNERLYELVERDLEWE